METFEHKKVQNEESTSTLPPELITDILSRLPLKHLLQVQVVSKEWQASTHNHYFIQKHMTRSPILAHWHNVYTEETSRSTTSDKDSFTYMHGCDGVVIVMNRTTKKYILWNPAIFRALELPDPHYGTINFAILYVPSTRDYRIVSFYRKDRVGCEVLTPGFSMSWKPLAFPNVPNPKKVLIIPTREDVHCVLVDETGVEMIVSLDVEAESFTVNPLDGVVATALNWDGKLGFANIVGDGVVATALNWDGKLGFANIVGKALEVVKLEDYKKHKWGAEKTIIPLPFLSKPGFEGIIRPLFNRGGDIWFWLEGKEIFSYTIETGRIDYIKKAKSLSYESEQIYSYKPSLLCFEGMQQDTDTNLGRFRPRYLSP